MPMKKRTKCAVPECGAPISGYSNLCDSHRIAGAIARMGNNTMIITSWLVQHGQEQGLIVLNDFALGDLFSGAEGFLAKLEEQGFTYARNLATPEELQAARSKKLASWSGPWTAQYPWQEGSQEKKSVPSELRALVLTNTFGPGAEGVNLIALVYRDGTIRLKYPDGGAANLNLQDRAKNLLTLDKLIETAEKSMMAYCSNIMPEPPQLTVCRVPDGLDDDATRKWLESLPGVELIDHPVQTAEFGNPIRPTGQQE